MFWKKKNKSKKKLTDPQQAAEARRKKIREQAMANATAAREHLGQDTIDRIAAKMTEMQKSNMAQARAKLENVDTDRMLDELKDMLDNR